MTPSTKSLLFGILASAAARYFLKSPWKAVAIIGTAVSVAYLFFDNLPEKNS